MVIHGQNTVKMVNCERVGKSQFYAQQENTDNEAMKLVISRTTDTLEAILHPDALSDITTNQYQCDISKSFSSSRQILFIPAVVTHGQSSSTRHLFIDPAAAVHH